MRKLLTKNNYYNGILLMQIMMFADFLLSSYLDYSSQLVSLVRYFTYTLAAGFIIKGLIKDKVKIDFISKLFLLWVLYLIISAIPDLYNTSRNYLFLKQFISGLLLIYIIPYFTRAKLDLDFFYYIFRLSFFLSIIYLIFTVIFFSFFTNDMRNGGEFMSRLLYGVPILLFTYNYHSKKKQWVIMMSVLLGIVVMMLLARRNAVAFLGSALFFSYILNFFSKQKHVRKNYFLMVFVFILFGLLLFSLYSTYFSLFFERMDTGFSSRDSIIELFFNDFNKTPKDWIWGRGIFGEFSGGALGDEETGLRDLIENGYLFLILKGGWIYLGLLILISLKAIYLGLLKSNNVLVKGLAFLIVINFIDMIGYGIPTVSLKFIMIFVAISACNSKQLRAYSDLTLSNKIGLK